jgi:hypothetical protein
LIYLLGGAIKIVNGALASVIEVNVCEPILFLAQKSFRKIAYGVEMLCYYLTQSHPKPIGLFFIQLSLQQESGA